MIIVKSEESVERIEAEGSSKATALADKRGDVKSLCDKKHSPELRPTRHNLL